MDRFGDALTAFFQFHLQADDWVAYAIFVISSGVIGLAIVLLDCCSVILGGDSYLDLTHGPRATPRAALVWTIGSMLAASLGLVSRVFQPTPLAALLAALTWRTLLAQLQRLATHPNQSPGDS